MCVSKKKGILPIRLVVSAPSLSLTETAFIVLFAKYRTFGFRVVYKSGPLWKK